MTYDAVKYWNRRKNPNSSTIGGDTPTHISFIKKNLKDVCSLLDFGPGVGRLLEAYAGISRIEGYDVSEIYKSELLEKAKQLNLNFSLIVEKKIGKLPYKDKEFDAAIATEVLLHQKPKYIELVMSELLRVAEKVIVITWMEEGVQFGSTSGPHCFHHNYFDICSRNSWKVFVVEKYKKQTMFVYGEKNGG